MNSRLGACFSLLVLLIISACELINPEEPIPSYIHVEPFTLNTNALQGSASAKITEAWLTIDDDFLGAYSLPADIPILKEGLVDIRLDAGIKDNGITATPEIYPFFKPFLTQVSLSPAQSVDIQPSTSYKDDIRFSMLENFERSPHFFTYEIDGNPETRIEVSNEDVFEGQRSGKITLTPDNSTIEVASDISRTFKELNKRGIYVYLELNYKTDAQIAFGLIGHSGGVFTAPERRYEPILFPKDDWNKIYLNLSGMLFDMQAEEYQIAILSRLPQDSMQAEIWLDNIKLVHF